MRRAPSDVRSPAAMTRSWRSRIRRHPSGRLLGILLAIMTMMTVIPLGVIHVVQRLRPRHRVQAHILPRRLLVRVVRHAHVLERRDELRDAPLVYRGGGGAGLVLEIPGMGLGPPGHVGRVPLVRRGSRQERRHGRRERRGAARRLRWCWLALCR